MSARILISLLSVAAAGFLLACGTANRDTSSSAHTYLHSDGDIDKDGPGMRLDEDDYTDRPEAGGREASNSIKPTIVKTIREYYAAAEENNGSKACALLDPTLASAVAEEPNRLLSSSSKTCATSVSLLLKQQHGILSAEEPSTMVVVAVRLLRTEGIAILGFRRVPETEIPLQRVGGVWKINSLFDGPLP